MNPTESRLRCQYRHLLEVLLALPRWAVVWAAACAVIGVTGSCSTASSDTSEGATTGDSSAPDDGNTATSGDADTADVSPPICMTTPPWCTVDSGSASSGSGSADPVGPSNCDGFAWDCGAYEAAPTVETVPQLVDALAAAAVGTIIRLAPGTYALTETLTVPGGVALVGGCAASTTILAPPTGPTIQIDDTADVLETACPGWSPSASTNIIVGLGFDGGEPAVRVRAGGTVIVHEVRFDGAVQAIAALDTQRIWLSRALADGNNAAAPQTAAIRLDVNQTNLAELRVQNAGGIGIFAEGAEATLSRVEVRQAAMAGLWLSGTDDSVFTVEAVSIENVVGHEATGTPGDGFVAVNGALQATNLSVQHSHAIGIRLQGTGGLLQQFSATDSGGPALYIEDVGAELPAGSEAPLRVSNGSLAEAHTGADIFGSRVLLEDLEIANVSQYGIQVARCSSDDPCNASHPNVSPPTAIDQRAGVELQRVTITAPGRYGIRISRDDVSMNQVSVSGPDRYGVELIEDALLRADNLTLTNSGGAAIAARGASDILRATGCTIAGVSPLELGLAEPVQSGVLLQEGSAATIVQSAVSAAGPAGIGVRDGGNIGAVRASLGVELWLEVSSTTFTDVASAVVATDLTGTNLTDLTLGAEVDEYVALQMPPGVMPVPEPISDTADSLLGVE